MSVGGSSRQSYGALLGFGQETLWGTRVTATSFMEFTSQNFKKSVESENLESLGTGRIAIRQVRKQKNIEGTLAYNLHPVDGIPLLKHVLMGTVTSALVTSATAYKHTFTTGDLSGINEKSLTFEVKPSEDTNTAFIYTGCRVNSFKLSGAINEPIKTEISFIGKEATTAAFATTTVSYNNNVIPYMFYHGNFFVDGVTETIIGFELTVENNLINDANARSLGQQELTVLPPGRRNISLTLTQRFDTLTAWSRFLGHSSAAVQLRFVTGYTIGSDSPGTTYSMFIDLPKIYYNAGGQPEISEVGILTYDVDIGAIADTTSSNAKDIFFTITNNVTSY